MSTLDLQPAAASNTSGKDKNTRSLGALDKEEKDIQSPTRRQLTVEEEEDIKGVVDSVEKFCRTLCLSRNGGTPTAKISTFSHLTPTPPTPNHTSKAQEKSRNYPCWEGLTASIFGTLCFLTITFAFCIGLKAFDFKFNQPIVPEKIIALLYKVLEKTLLAKEDAS